MNISKIRQDLKSEKNFIHFNNAGASLPPKTVIDKMTQYLQEEASQGGYETVKIYQEELDSLYPVLAKLLNAQKEEIAFLGSATYAWNMAFWSIPFQKHDIILTSQAEYISNYLSYLRMKEEKEIEIKVVPNDEYGQISLKALEEMIDSKVVLISLVHIPSNGGLVNPAEEVGKIAKKHHVLYLLDACQSAGQYPLDVQKLGCDMLSATGRKYMRGPRGTGFLYVRKEIMNRLKPIFPDGRSAEWINAFSYQLRADARRFETFEMNLANKLGLLEATQYILDIGIENIWERIVYLSRILREKLSQIEGVKLRDLGKVKSGLITFIVENKKQEDIQHYLQQENINVHVVPRDSTLLDSLGRNLEVLLRASIHYYNTEEEIDFFIQQLEKLI